MITDFGVAERLFEQGKYKQALFEFQKFLAQEPDNSFVYQNIARCLMYLKKYADAETHARKALVRGATTLDTHDSNARKCNDLGIIIYE